MTTKIEPKYAQKIVEPGNMTRYWIIVGRSEDNVPFVALPDFGKAATMEYRYEPHWSYVSEKLKLAHGDAVPVAKILAEWENLP